MLLKAVSATQKPSIKCFLEKNKNKVKQNKNHGRKGEKAVERRMKGKSQSQKMKKASLKEEEKWYSSSGFDVHRKRRRTRWGHRATGEGNWISISGHRYSRCCRLGGQYYTAGKASKIVDLNPCDSWSTEHEWSRNCSHSVRRSTTKKAYHWNTFPEYKRDAFSYNQDTNLNPSNMHPVEWLHSFFFSKSLSMCFPI